MPEIIEQQPVATLTPPPQRRFEIPEEKAPEPAPAASAPAPKPEAQNIEEQAPSAPPEAKPEEEVTPEQAAKREGRRFERRLDKAYRQRAEALARAELLEKRLTELETRAVAPKAEGEPKFEQFDYDPEKYAQAKADFERSKVAKEFEAKQRESGEKATRQKLISDWEEKVEKALDKYEDFNDLVGALEPTNPLIHAIMEADNGEEIAYHLAKNPKEANRIAKLTPTAQIRAIGRLEVELSKPAVEPKTPSKAPAPITPLTGQAPVKNDEPSEADDTADWIRKRRKQVYGKR